MVLLNQPEAHSSRRWLLSDPFWAYRVQASGSPSGYPNDQASPWHLASRGLFALTEKDWEVCLS